MSKMSKSGKPVGYFDTKDQEEDSNIWLYIQDMTNQKLIGYFKVNLTMLWRF